MQRSYSHTFTNLVQGSDFYAKNCSRIKKNSKCYNYDVTGNPWKGGGYKTFFQAKSPPPPP